MPLTKTGSSKSSTWTQEGKGTAGEAAKSLGWDCTCSVDVYQTGKPNIALVLSAQFWRTETVTMSTKNEASCLPAPQEGSLKSFGGTPRPSGSVHPLGAVASCECGWPKNACAFERAPSVKGLG